MRKKEIRLYNLLFPIWMFFIWPSVLWLILLPANFVIDSVVLLLAMDALRLENRISLWKKSIVRIWLIGFLSDFIGAALIFVLMLVSDWLKLPFNLILFPATTIIAIPGVLLAGVLIFFLNKRFSFQKLQDELSGEQIHKLCLALAIFTAPYAMFIPLYG